MLSFFSFIFWNSLSFSEKEDLIGVTIVAIGVLGEVFLEIAGIWFPYNPTNFSPLEIILGFQKKHLEIVFVSLVAIGVGLELYALPKSLNESHEQIAKLENKTEELRKQNDAFEIKLQPRRITAEQREKFIKIMSYANNFSKMPIKVFVGKSDYETDNFAEQFREMLDQSGYGEDAKIAPDDKSNFFFVATFEHGIGGVAEIPDIKVPPFDRHGKYQELIRNDAIDIQPADAYYIGKESEVIAIFSGEIPTTLTNPTPSVMVLQPTTNSPSTNVVFMYSPTQDSNAIIYGVSKIIDHIGIPIGTLNGNIGLKPGEVGFLIPEKSY